MNAATIRQAARQCGFDEAEYLPIRDIRVYPEVRKICQGNSCRGYGAPWACPPGVGSLEECRRQLMQFDQMLLLSKVYPLEDSFDFEGMQAGMQHFKQVIDALEDRLEGHLTNYRLLGNEGCSRCAQCTYPHAPCRFPQRLHPSLEGYGLMVSELAKTAGMAYHHGPDTVTFFGALLLKNNSERE